MSEDAQTIAVDRSDQRTSPPVQVINPAVASAAEDWSVASVEQTELGRIGGSS